MGKKPYKNYTCFRLNIFITTRSNNIYIEIYIYNYIKTMIIHKESYDNIVKLRNNLLTVLDLYTSFTKKHVLINYI
jgi:hypothetical protein